MEQKPRLGKPGGVKRIAEELRILRQQKLSQKVRDMIEEYARRERELNKRSAKPLQDLDV